MDTYHLTKMFRDMSRKPYWTAPIEELANKVLSRLAADGLTGAHLRPVRVSYFDEGYATAPQGFLVLLYAYYTADGYRLTPPFESRWEAQLDLIYRHGGLSDQQLRWSDAMAAAAGEEFSNFGERGITREESKVQRQLEKALTMVAQPAPQTESLTDDSHLLPHY